MTVLRFAAITALLFASACATHRSITTAPASAPLSAAQQAQATERQIYATLITAQTALEGLLAQPALVSRVKTQVNQAVAAYNVAEQAFVDYEAAKSANLATPADLLKVQQMVLDIQAKIAALGQAFNPTVTATPASPKGAQ